MQTIRRMGWADLGSWPAALASLLPLWLFSLAVSAEGFPPPFVTAPLAISFVVIGLALGIVLLWKGWMTFELLLYSLFPFFVMVSLDEISTRYKTPLLLLAALLLSIGILLYQRSLSRSVGLAWLLLLLAYGAAWVFSLHAAGNYWDMVGQLHFPPDCMPYAHDCPLLAGRETPFWSLFFRL